MGSLASWSFRHRRLVLLGWLVLVAGVFGLAQVTGSAYSNSFALPHTESTRASNLLKANTPAHSGDSEQVVIASQHGAKLTDPAVRTQADALFTKLSKLPDVTGIVSPYGAAQMNADHSVAFATLSYSKPADTLPAAVGKTLLDTARSSRSAQLNVAVDGQVAGKAASPSLGGVGIGIGAAAVVLLLAFGSLLAASLPLPARCLCDEEPLPPPRVRPRRCHHRPRPVRSVQIPRS
jgi:RND superfamily putative drug exporter